MKSKEKVEFVTNRIKEIIKLYPPLYNSDGGYSLNRLIELECGLGNLEPHETEKVKQEIKTCYSKCWIS